MTLVVERPAGDWDSRHNGVFQPSLTISTDASDFQRTPRKWLVVKTHHRTPHQLQGASSRSHCLKKGTWTEEHGHPGSSRQHCRSTLPEQTGQLSITETSPPHGEKFIIDSQTRYLPSIFTYREEPIYGWTSYRGKTLLCRSGSSSQNTNIGSGGEAENRVRKVG